MVGLTVDQMEQNLADPTVGSLAGSKVGLWATLKVGQMAYMWAAPRDEKWAEQ